jgi:hypothetical protein
MIPITDRKYNSNLRPRSKLQHLGGNFHYDVMQYPIRERLSIYEDMSRYESVIKFTLNILLNSVIGSLGPIQHPDSDIQNFLNYNIDRLNNIYCIDILSQIKSMAYTTLWAGFSVTEKLYELDNGMILLRDLVQYHPKTITIRTNKKGRLVEGEPAFDLHNTGYKSGVFQTGYDTAEVQLPLWKICYATHGFEFNNYYGSSLLEPCYRWHILKEAYVDMLTLCLDRYGVESINPATGEVQELSAQDLLEQQIQNTNPQDGNVLFLPFSESDMKPSINTLSASNDLGDTFYKAIRFCEVEQVRSMLIHYGFIESKTGKDAELSERQIEFFNNVVSSLYSTLIRPICNQVFHNLIIENFSRESAKIPPFFPLRDSSRPETHVARTQMIQGLTELGFFNPTNSSDWAMVREMVDATPRDFEPSDLEFIKKIAINPRQPSKSSTSDPSRKASRGARSTEGNVQGTLNPGRSDNITTKEQKKRPMTGFRTPTV